MQAAKGSRLYVDDGLGFMSKPCFGSVAKQGEEARDSWQKKRTTNIYIYIYEQS